MKINLDMKIAAFILSCLYSIANQGHSVSATCDQYFKSEGCFVTDRCQFKLLFSARMEIVWGDYSNFLTNLVCKCAKEAKAKFYSHYGIQFYGECWGSNSSATTLIPASIDTDCLAKDFSSCDNGDDICTGKETTIKLYSLPQEQTFLPINGGYGNWGDWSECTVTCGNGQQTRQRSCNLPLPQFGGKECEDLGPPSETTKCSKGECIPSYQFESAGCSNSIKGDLFDFYSASPSRSAGAFCRSSYFLPSPPKADSYIMKASLFSFKGPSGVLDGNSGFIYNAKDLNNFQYIYFMLSSSANCYTTGTVRNGFDDFFGSRRKTCDPLKLFGNQWLNIEIAVTNAEARLTLNGVYLSTVSNSMPYAPKGGAILRNGERNEVYFKHIRLV